MKKLFLFLIFLDAILQPLASHCSETKSKPPIMTRVSTFLVKSIIGFLPKKITIGIPVLIFTSGVMVGSGTMYLIKK